MSYQVNERQVLIGRTSLKASHQLKNKDLEPLCFMALFFYVQNFLPEFFQKFLDYKPTGKSALPE